MIASNTPGYFDNHYAKCRECGEVTTGLEARLRKFNDNLCHCGGEFDFIPKDPQAEAPR